MKELWIVFVTVFLAELGDKTQVATLLFAADDKLSRAGIFGAASLALVLSSLLAVVFGTSLAGFISPEKIRWLAGVGFVAVGIWTLLDIR